VNFREMMEQNDRAIIEHYRKLVENDSETYLPKLASSLGMLGAAQFSRSGFEEAEKSYTEGLEIYRELAKTNPETYLSRVLACLNNSLAPLYEAKKEYDKAEEVYLEVLQLRQRLKQENSEKNDSITMELYNLSRMQYAIKKLHKAEESCQAALKMARKSAEAYPGPSEFVAKIIHVLAYIQNGKKEYDKAEKSYKEAFQIQQELRKIAEEKFKITRKNSMEKYRKLGQTERYERWKNTQKKPPSFKLEMIRIDMGVFYQVSKPDRELSIQLTNEGLTNLALSNQLAIVRRYIKIGLDVLDKWGINTDEYLAEKNIDLSKEVVSDGSPWFPKE